MTRKQWMFEALDTLFFRESRPMESIGGSQLSSAFPPPARTMIGAIRTVIGEAHHVNWREYADGPHPLRDIMGGPDDLGPLRFTGPYLLSKNQRLYPAPLALLLNGDQEQTRLQPAEDADATVCDLGRVCLPVKANQDLLGAKPRETAYLTEAGLVSFLAGQPVAPNDIVERETLFGDEERLGIALDCARRTTGDGLLYQTQHIRPLPQAGLAIGMQVSGLNDDKIAAQGMARLGAEGRLASWRCEDSTTLKPIEPRSGAHGLLLQLLTPALFEQGWLPDGFTPQEDNGHTVWVGEIAGIRLTLITAVVGKPQREGGWDMARHAPRALRSFVPAGSCYFCKTEGDLQTAQLALHGVQTGQETEYGRGELAVGYW